MASSEAERVPNGIEPHSSSKSTTPTDQTSTCGPYASSSTSGAKYSGVPYGSRSSRYRLAARAFDGS